MSIYHLLSPPAQLKPILKVRDDWRTSDSESASAFCTVNHLSIYESFIYTLATFAYIEY